jgi:hypothetical protein
MATVQEKAMWVLRFFDIKSVITRQNRCRNQYGKAPSDNVIRRWLKQFQETGNVLDRKGAGLPSNSQEDVDRIQEAFSRSTQKSTKPFSLQLCIPQTTYKGLFITAFTSLPTGQGNPDNNLESPCIITIIELRAMR